MTEIGREIMTTRHYSPAIATMIDNYDGADPWGSAMEMGWAIAEVATAAGELRPQGILEVLWSYARPRDLDGIVEDAEGESITASLLALSYLAGDVSDDDLVFAARVLNRYLDLCKRAGLDDGDEAHCRYAALFDQSESGRDHNE